MEDEGIKLTKSKRYEHIPVRPSTFVSFRILKSKFENKREKKISDNQFIIDLIGGYSGL